MKFIVLYGFLFTLAARSSHASNIRVDPLVIVNQGLIRGEKSADGEYSTFLGIPYAEIDLENPFGDSLAAPSFGDEVYNAYDGTSSCPQPGSGSLDCLRLNIYVPTKANSKNPMPVLVWIHGGSFKIGSASMQDGQILARHDVVVVTVNYRLGPYGFMCLDSPAVPGNQGLKDQLTALRWVRDNISAFGGNPYNVTIAGQSAGSMAVNFHLYTSSEKLFNKAILQSGVVHGNVLVNGNENAAIELAEHLGFNTTESDQALRFLTATSPNLVIAAATELNSVFRPCKERSFSGIDSFIDTDPYSLTNKKKVRNTPILIGTTSSEHYGNDIIDYSQDVFYKTLSPGFNLDETELIKAADVVKHFYIGDETEIENVKSAVIQFYDDFWYNHPNEREIRRLIDEEATVYEYVYSYVSENDKGNRDERLASHSAELKYIFSDNSESLNEEEQIISNNIALLWANFIKYGNPTPQATELIPVTWPAVTEDSRPYFNIDTEITLQSRFGQQRMALWDLFYEHYGQFDQIIRKCTT